MKLLMMTQENVLGLNGTINFIRGQPVIFYGENLSGKTNIINTLRYCLIPKDPRQRKRTYSEEQRLTKNEMLLSPLEEGKVTIYFTQQGTLYNLIYLFKRLPSGTVRQTQRMYEAEEVPILEGEDEELKELLEGLDWKTLDIHRIDEITNKLIEIDIYPEILDTLIAPSNVKNFSKTINKEIVTIPKVISQTISNIRETVGRYLKNLETMNNILALEKESHHDHLQAYQQQLTLISPQEAAKIKRMFARDIHQNLKTFLKETERTLEKIPDETKQIESLIMDLDDNVRDQTQLIQELVNEVQNKVQVKNNVELNYILEEAETTIGKWGTTFQTLPSVDNIDAFIDFTIPKDYQNFKYETLETPEKVKSIFTSFEDTKNLLKKVKDGLQKYDITFERLPSLITSFKRLKNAIKAPLEEPPGDNVIISYSEEVKRSQISIPVDLLIKKQHYLTIHSTPLTHKPQERSVEMDELVKVQLITLTNTINELTKTKKNKTEAQKTYQTLETTLPVLHEEEVKLNRRREEIVKTLAQVQSVWNQKYGSLCRVFDFEPQKVDLSTKDTFESSIELLEQTIEDTNKILQANLKEKFKDFSEIIIKKEISEQEVDNIITILTQKIEKLLETKQRCEEIRDWINKYLEEILDVEQKLKALDLTNTLIVILKEIFTPIYDKTDLETIAERLAESIEVEVKEAYQRILADESLKFTHVGKAMFRNTLNDQPITHPSGSQRASISVGIMMSLAKAFNLPLILDEATDRYDSNHVKTFMEYVTAIVSDSTNPQISLAIYKTMDVENNPELLSVIQGATTYGIERKDPLNKIIKKLDLIN